ncbi:hypothetical protein [Streptomyces sp. NPDC050704]|uniref:hypothetical protein n=1 Tax=Streptomyces sp. NPDC050704 TaxID=3157219 RepID=UPI0034413459
MPVVPWPSSGSTPPGCGAAAPGPVGGVDAGATGLIAVITITHVALIVAEV